MVANFASGGAAINQLARIAGATLRVIPLSSTNRPPISPNSRRSASRNSRGRDGRIRAVAPQCDLICLGEMGIGNTTAAAAIAAPCSAAAVRAGRAAAPASMKRPGAQAHGHRPRARRHAAVLDDPLAVAAALGGRELAAILGATLAARRQRIPVLLDGFVCTAAVAPLAKLRGDTLAHRMPVMSRLKPGTACCLKRSGFRRWSISTCGSAKHRAPRWRCYCCRRAGLPYRHGDICRGGRVG